MEMKEIPDREQTLSISPYSMLAQNRRMDSARNLSKGPNPFNSHYERTRGTPEVSLHPNFPRLGIFHPPIPPVRSQQHLERSQEETRHANLQNENIGEKFASFGVNSLGEWYGTVPTPGSHYRQYLECVEKQSKVLDFSEAKHNEERGAAATPATSSTLVESSSSKLQCNGMKDLPEGPISPSSSSDQTISDEELEAKILGSEHRMTFLMGCRKIKDDCKAGNFPMNVVDRAKYLWKILSEAKDDCLCSDGTMGKLQALLVACCIYIACQQCNFSRTFTAIRILTNTLSSAYKESIPKSLEVLWEFRNDTNCSCLRAFRTPPEEECCQICHKLHKKSTSSDTFEPLVLCMRCSGAYHMSCATKCNAIIDTPKPGDLFCRRCVPCTIHPHVEQNPLNLTKRTLALASSDAVSKDRKRIEKEPGASSLNNDLSESYQQGQPEANITGKRRIERLKEQCRKVAKELHDAHDAYLTALEENFLEITMPDPPVQNQQTEAETFLSSIGITEKRKMREPLSEIITKRVFRGSGDLNQSGVDRQSCYLPGRGGN
ncbi:32334136-4381-4879-8025-6bf397f79f11 [Sclerotinia trifoliorum]|uniref:32334136-4381-4879-8025-6bf397f79f11 n=1 Tax=Sclerotinia trifoliorum TaxID=28548 RepID=A0A8H2W1I2_9HELO|nr:32334136-4381-4879-8025-6bf397f79f11 [Sclerotinia trifoliorum]